MNPGDEDLETQVGGPAQRLRNRRVKVKAEVEAAEEVAKSSGETVEERRDRKSVV